VIGPLNFDHGLYGRSGVEAGIGRRRLPLGVCYPAALGSRPGAALLAGPRWARNAPPPALGVRPGLLLPRSPSASSPSVRAKKLFPARAARAETARWLAHPGLWDRPRRLRGGPRWAHQRRGQGRAPQDAGPVGRLARTQRQRPRAGPRLRASTLFPPARNRLLGAQQAD